MNATTSILVKMPAGLEDLVPAYLESKRADIAKYENWFKESNFVEIEKASHKLKGSAGGYGLEELGRIARDLNHAAKARDLTQVEAKITEMCAHLESVVLVDSIA